MVVVKLQALVYDIFPFWRTVPESGARRLGSGWSIELESSSSMGWRQEWLEFGCRCDRRVGKNSLPSLLPPAFLSEELALHADVHKAPTALASYLGGT